MDKKELTQLDPIVLPSGSIPRVQHPNGMIQTGPIPPHLRDEYSEHVWEQGIIAGIRLGILKPKA